MVQKPIRSISDVPGLSAALTFRKNRTLFVGDSFVAGYAGDSTPVISQVTWASWLQAQMSFINGGVTGDSLAQVAARLPALLTANNPSRVVVQAGTNDISTARTLAQMKTDAAAISSLLVARGIDDVVWRSTLPRTDVPSGYQTQNRDFIRWLYQHCLDNGFRFIDDYTVFADSAGAPKTGYLAGDLRHPSALGCRVLAETLAASFLASGQVCASVLAGATSNLVPNGDFATDSNSDGLADSWSSSKTGALVLTTSLSTNPSGGKWQKVAISGGGTSDYGRVTQIVGTGALVAGAVYDFECDVISNATVGSTTRIIPQCVIQDVSNATLLNVNPHSIACAVPNAVRFRIPFTMPAGANRAVIQFYVYGSTATDASIGRVVLRPRP